MRINGVGGVACAARLVLCVSAGWIVFGEMSSVLAQSSIRLETIVVEGTGEETATGPVRGYNASRAASATKTDTPLKETPQSISVVTADTMRDQGVTTIQEIVRYVPGVLADPYGPD